MKVFKVKTGLSPPANYFKGPFRGGISLVDHLCYFFIVFVMLSRLHIAALWSPAGKGLTSWLSFECLICDCFFPIWLPGSGVVLDCIDS